MDDYIEIGAACRAVYSAGVGRRRQSSASSFDLSVETSRIFDKLPSYLRKRRSFAESTLKNITL